MGNYLTDKAQKEIEELWALRREAIKILDYVNSEWKSDPQSVQCFDLQIVERSKVVVDRIKTLDFMYEDH